jgi:tRNA (adenine22-N1)-methyltransferase
LQDIQASEWDTLVVAGMGGETIAQILEPLQREPQNPLQHKTLILQPNTKQLELLRFLQASGYAVEQEVLVRDRRRDYYIVAASA